MNRIKMNYFYGEQANQFSFIRIPKELVVGEAFSSLSVQAKVLYGIFLDRMGMASKNRWLDEEGRVYIVYSVDEIQAIMVRKYAESQARKMQGGFEEEDEEEDAAQ